MREIIFRGKRTDNGEWVEGCLQIWSDGSCGIQPPTLLEPEYAVDPSTVGEFTGLYDKNGKQIFEGDIVRLERWFPSCGKTEVVKYHDGGFAPFSVAGWECTPDWEECEVIGNIHDNPELIGGE